jgi:hypothetical protein
MLALLTGRQIHYELEEFRDTDVGALIGFRTRFAVFLGFSHLVAMYKLVNGTGARECEACIMGKLL